MAHITICNGSFIWSSYWCCVYVELITRVSDGCSLVLVQEGALPVLCDVINGTNRNRVSLLLVETALQILLNLTRVSVCMCVCVMCLCNVSVYVCLHVCSHVI